MKHIFPEKNGPMLAEKKINRSPPFLVDSPPKKLCVQVSGRHRMWDSTDGRGVPMLFGLNDHHRRLHVVRHDDLRLEGGNITDIPGGARRTDQPNGSKWVLSGY